MSEVVSSEPLHVRIASLVPHLKGEYPPHVLEDVTLAAEELKTVYELRSESNRQASSGLEFFEKSVDDWGAAEWFNRLVHAITEQDKAVLSGEEARFAICRMVAGSTAMTLAREYASDIRLALSSQARLSEAVKVLEFVRRWAIEKEGNGTSAEERLSIIANCPGIKNLATLGEENHDG